jgi:hypothetical protein
MALPMFLLRFSFTEKKIIELTELEITLLTKEYAELAEKVKDMKDEKESD